VDNGVLWSTWTMRKTVSSVQLVLNITFTGAAALVIHSQSLIQTRCRLAVSAWRIITRFLTPYQHWFWRTNTSSYYNEAYISLLTRSIPLL
jgi:hypothetical protein